MSTKFELLRSAFHAELLQTILTTDSKTGSPSNADKSSRLSTELAKGMLTEIGFPSLDVTKAAGQTSGKNFEVIVGGYLSSAMSLLQHLTAFDLKVSVAGSIDEFEQYEHLKMISAVLEGNPMLRATLGDYLIKPDIVVSKLPLSDNIINRLETLIEGHSSSNLSPILARNSKEGILKILHASISCKWTIRSDRAQNSRTEGLNLIRNRKGRTPHIAIVTAEPLPSRLASIALGTGDIDCVYHIALQELQIAAQKLGNKDAIAVLEMLVNGKRLRDMSDLPFDLLG